MSDDLERPAGDRRVVVMGAGAFGTALAVVMARDGADVTLWARDADQVAEMQASRRNPRHLHGVTLPERLCVSAELPDVVDPGVPVLLAVPMQALSGVLDGHGHRFRTSALIACCKGIELSTLRGPTAVIADHCPLALPAVLTGPSFAADIAAGLPTALTLACHDAAGGAILQRQLSTPSLRLYHSTDVRTAELGGALKNVIAIAAGMVIGRGLGDSARAALMTRGLTEMSRLARALGSDGASLEGLAGLGDLILTCTSEQSRNFRFGLALGRGESFPPGVTVEGAATARAAARLARERGIDMPITTMVAAVLDGTHSLAEAAQALMSRPLKEE